MGTRWHCGQKEKVNVSYSVFNLLTRPSYIAIFSR